MSDDAESEKDPLTRPAAGHEPAGEGDGEAEGGRWGAMEREGGAGRRGAGCHGGEGEEGEDDTELKHIVNVILGSEAFCTRLFIPLGGGCGELGRQQTRHVHREKHIHASLLDRAWTGNPHLGIVIFSHGDGDFEERAGRGSGIRQS